METTNFFTSGSSQVLGVGMVHLRQKVMLKS